MIFQGSYFVSIFFTVSWVYPYCVSICWYWLAFLELTWVFLIFHLQNVTKSKAVSFPHCGHSEMCSMLNLNFQFQATGQRKKKFRCSVDPLKAFQPQTCSLSSVYPQIKFCPSNRLDYSIWYTASQKEIPPLTVVEKNIGTLT